MKRHRYMIVEHPRTAEHITKDKQFHEFVLPIHTLLGTFHWARLDDEHVLVTGYYEASHHERLHNHPKVSMLPSIGTSKKLKGAMALHHWSALSSKMKLDEGSTSSDVAEAAETMFGALFAADK